MFGQKTSWALVVCLLVVWGVSAPLHARPPGDVFPDSVSAGEYRLTKNGQGLAEWGFVGIDLYWAALYIEARTSVVADIIDEQRAKQIQLYFVRALTRSQMVEAYTASVKANAGTAFPSYRKALQQLTAALKAVRVKDVLVFTYLPGTGLKVEQNGSALVTIEDVPFARLFFRLYVGEKPPTEALRKALVGSWKTSPLPRPKPATSKPKPATSKPKALKPKPLKPKPLKPTEQKPTEQKPTEQQSGE